MRRQIFDLQDVKDDGDVVEVLFPNGRQISGCWFEDHILDAYINRDDNKAKFYVQDDKTLLDIELEGIGMIKASADALVSLYLYVSKAGQRYADFGLFALSAQSERVCDAIDKLLAERGYC